MNLSDALLEAENKNVVLEDETAKYYAECRVAGVSRLKAIMDNKMPDFYAVCHKELPYEYVSVTEGEQALFPFGVYASPVRVDRPIPDCLIGSDEWIVVPYHD